MGAGGDATDRGGPCADCQNAPRGTPALAPLAISSATARVRGAANCKHASPAPAARTNAASKRQGNCSRARPPRP
eukprot:7290788-Lingulodinium_polyedra.AAC.1